MNCRSPLPSLEGAVGAFKRRIIRRVEKGREKETETTTKTQKFQEVSEHSKAPHWRWLHPWGLCAGTDSALVRSSSVGVGQSVRGDFAAGSAAGVAAGVGAARGVVAARGAAPGGAAGVVGAAAAAQRARHAGAAGVGARAGAVAGRAAQAVAARRVAAGHGGGVQGWRGAWDREGGKGGEKGVCEGRAVVWARCGWVEMLSESLGFAWGFQVIDFPGTQGPRIPESGDSRVPEPQDPWIPEPQDPRIPGPQNPWIPEPLDSRTLGFQNPRIPGF